MKKKKLLDKLIKFLEKNKMTVIQYDKDNNEIITIPNDQLAKDFLVETNKHKDWEMKIIGSKDYHSVSCKKGLHSCTCGAFKYRDTRPCHHVKIALLKRYFAEHGNPFLVQCISIEDNYLNDVVTKNTPLSVISYGGSSEKFGSKGSSDKFDNLFDNSSLSKNTDYNILLSDMKCVEGEI